MNFSILIICLLPILVKAQITPPPLSISYYESIVDDFYKSRGKNECMGGRNYADYLALFKVMYANSNLYYWNFWQFDEPYEQLVTIYCRNSSTANFAKVTVDSIGDFLRLIKNIVFIIHGWTDTYKVYYIKQFTDAYLKNIGNATVCAVDWSPISQTEPLTIAEPHSFDVAAVVTNFIRALIQKYSITLDGVTLVGHSLGAHICGVVGDYLNGQVKMIMAGAPCGPGCSQEYTSPNNSLTNTSAKYVQTVVTDQNGLGAPTWGYHGYQIFWVNCGGPVQAGCGIFNPIGAHYYSMDRIVSSLDRSNVNGARLCDDLVKYTLGDCSNEHCDILGFYGDRTVPGNYYFFTGTIPPFANGQKCPAATLDAVNKGIADNLAAPLTSGTCND